MTTVLLVEDDPASRQGLEMALRRLGYGVRCAATGEAALDGFGDAGADVVVLDVMLPGVDGLEVCRRLRRYSDVPVIMLTARDDDLDIVGGLEAGADDYVTKPAEPLVLDARIRAVLRRLVRASAPADTHGDLVIDRASLIVQRAGQQLSLTPTELRLLLVLSGSPRQVRNLDTLLGQDGIAGIKTGSDTAAGGCILLAAWRHARGHDTLIVAAALGQPGTIATMLPRALQAGHQLVLALGRALDDRDAQPTGNRRPVSSPPTGAVTEPGQAAARHLSRQGPAESGEPGRPGGP